MKRQTHEKTSSEKKSLEKTNSRETNLWKGKIMRKKSQYGYLIRRVQIPEKKILNKDVSIFSCFIFYKIIGLLSHRRRAMPSAAARTS